MSDIIVKMKKEIIKRSNEFEKETKGTKDEYNLYEKHIKYVHKYIKIISETKSIDREVLELSALLHDISMTDSNLDRIKHNEYSTVIAEELLVKENYPKEKIELVKKCILNHSSKRKKYRTTKEEQLLVDADALSHFDNIESVYSLAYNVINLNEKESIEFVKEKLTRDYNEISENVKYLIEDKYKKIMKSYTIDELLNIKIKGEN